MGDMALLDRNTSHESATRPLRAVVVPIDGTDDSARAVGLATRLAATLDIELVPVSVIESFRHDASTRVERLRELLADVPSSVERRIVQARFPARAIAEESIDGIVCLATTSQPFDDDGFHHSVVDQLVASATSPVIVLGPKCKPDPELSRVVVAIDPEHDQKGLVYWATQLGYHLSIPVEHVHVAETAPAGLGSKVRHDPLPPGQSVADRLIELAEGALLVMGSHGRTGFSRLVQGSVGAAVLPTATQPVMILGPNASRPI